jgi:Ni/Co efflux regulator RcnB
MIKHITIVAAAFLAATSAFAQSPERQAITDSRPQLRAQAKVAAKSPGKIAAASGDTVKTAEGGSIGTDAAAAAGEKRHQRRDARKPNRRKPVPGGTPN